MIPEKFLAILNRAKVEYVVVGGVAMVAHGSAKSTFDLDVCYNRSKQNIEILCRACRVLSLDGLYRAKSAAGRDKDVEALKEIKGLQELKGRLAEE